MKGKWKFKKRKSEKEVTSLKIIDEFNWCNSKRAIALAGCLSKDAKSYNHRLIGGTSMNPAKFLNQILLKICFE